MQAHFRDSFPNRSRVAKIVMLRRPDPHDYPRSGLNILELG